MNEIKISDILLEYYNFTDKHRGEYNRINGRRSGHFYGFGYDEIFSNFRKEDNLNILEIGVENGYSLEAWKKFFPNSKVYGVDIVDNRKIINDKIFFILSDIKKIDNEFENIFFDIIIDDGSHILSDVLFVVNNYIKKLKKNGILIIEDAQEPTSWVNSINKIIENKYSLKTIDTRMIGERDDFLIIIKNDLIT